MKIKVGMKMNKNFTMTNFTFYKYLLLIVRLFIILAASQLKHKQKLQYTSQCTSSITLQ